MALRLGRHRLIGLRSSTFSVKATLLSLVGCQATPTTFLLLVRNTSYIMFYYTIGRGVCWLEYMEEVDM